MSTPWLVVARRLLNTKEAPGSSNNPVIIQWAKKFGGWLASFYNKDEIPWCGLFVAHCLREADAQNLPRHLLSALAWADYGSETTPRVGAILVFRRPGGGHVGFYTGETATAFRVLGGNQSDAVTETWIDKKRLVNCRWPKEFPVNTSPLRLNHQGRLSTNEA